MTRVQQVQQRLIEQQCIDCGAENMAIDRGSGFCEHRCYACNLAFEEAEKAARRRANESVYAYNKRLKREGIENLDRLLGVEP